MTVAAAVFALGGCGVAVCGILAEVEACVLKFGLIAYAALAGPLCLAAVVSRMKGPSKHRSFRLSPLPYMEGKRVKRRLLLIAEASYLLALAVTFLAAAAVMLWISAMGQLPGRRVWVTLLFFTAPVGAGRLMLLALKTLFIRLGWMTPEEAQPFPFRMRRYPESWLEPVDEQESTDRADTE